MIVTEYTVICDGCGRGDLGSEGSAFEAQFQAQRADWTHDIHEPALVAEKHWCPTCAAQRTETSDDDA